MARSDLTDFEWAIIAPLLRNKPPGVSRVDDRRVLNGIFWRLQTGSPRADIPSRYGAHATCVSRFNRCKADVWSRILKAAAEAYGGDIQMVDYSSIRVHEQAAHTQERRAIPVQVSFPGRLTKFCPCGSGNPPPLSMPTA